MADTTTVRVRVTQEDIDAGVPSDGCNCPIALAIGRVLPNGYCVDVGVTTVAVFHSERKLDYVEVALPYEAHAAILDFDFSDFMEPFEFDLSLPTTEAAHG